MRKTFFSVVSLAILLSLSGGMAPAAADQRVILRTGAGPTGTGKDFRMQMASEAIRRGNKGWIVKVINGLTTIAEISMIGRGEMSFTVVDAASMPDIAEGYYGGVKMTQPVQLRWLFPSTAYICGLYMLADVPLDSYGDIKKKKYPLKYSMGRKGTDPYNINMHVMKAYGFSPEDITRWGGKRQNQGSGRSARLMGDGLMEAMLQNGNFPNSNLLSLSRKRALKVAFINEPEIQAKLSKKGFLKVPIAAGQGYPFVKKATSTMAMPGLITVSAGMKDEIAYHMTRAVWEQKEKFLYPLHVLFRTYLKPEVITSWTTAMRSTLHPGAAKYWQEQGLLK